MPRMPKASQTSVSKMLRIEARTRFLYILFTRLLQGTFQIPQMKDDCSQSHLVYYVCRKRGQSIKRFTDPGIMRGTTASVEGKVGLCTVQNSNGLVPCDHTGLALLGRFQTPFPKLIITEMVFLDLK